MSPSPPLLISTRFGLGIEDRSWFEHRLELISAITAPSILAQEDDSFLWTVFVNSDLPADISAALEELLAPFGERAIISRDGYGPSRLLQIAHERGLEGGGYVLTGQIDDDDAWARTMVGRVRSRVASWLSAHAGEPGLALSFEDGLIWVMYEMLDVHQLNKTGRRVERPDSVRPYSCPFSSMSVFVCSTVEEAMTSITRGHPRIPEEARSRGMEVDVIGSAEPMWLYCRHKQVSASIQRNDAEDQGLTLADLADRFGIEVAATERYLEAAPGYGYGRMMGNFAGRRRALSRSIDEIEQRLATLAPGHPERIERDCERRRLLAELAELTTDVVGDLDGPPPNLRGEST